MGKIEITGGENKIVVLFVDVTTGRIVERKSILHVNTSTWVSY